MDGVKAGTHWYLRRLAGNLVGSSTRRILYAITPSLSGLRSHRSEQFK
jgi:hypothetical protein